MDERNKNLLENYGARLEHAGVPKPYDEARAILERVLGKNKSPEAIQDSLERALRLRAERMPLERIFGSALFCGLPFKLADKVFRPYPETEDMVHYALSSASDKNAPLRILDLGTGTGCVLLALLHALPRASGVGIDLNEDILGLARKNAAALGLTERTEFSAGD